MNDHTQAASLLNTKQHYEILDGLRGVAAIAVVIFHFMEIAIPDYNDNFIAHAYLAVDFFFCLSGFVIAYAYDKKLTDIGFAKFFKQRLIRLQPLVIIGSIWGLVAFIVDPFSDLWVKYADKLGIAFAASCLMIPYPLVPERYFNIFHLNPPSWSLFWEYVASIVYAVVLIRVGKKALWVLVAIGAVALVYEAHHATNLGVGWSGDNFWGGGIRVFFSFLAGILVYRSGYIIRNKLGFLITSGLLLLTLVVPFSASYNWIIEPSIVIVCFPLLIAIGAGAAPGARAQRLCELSGNISYPLYMIHYPFIWIFMSYVETHKPTLLLMSIITVVGTLSLIGLSYLVLVFMDIPVRMFLKNKLGVSSSTVSG
jgi:peptidoglycan/LPS O-acetylase OafA/YrhL